MEIRKTKENKKGYVTEYIIMENIQDNLKWTTFGGVDRNGRPTSRTFNVQIPEDMIPFFEEERIKVGAWTPQNTTDPDVSPVYTISVTVDMDHRDWYPCDIYMAKSAEDEPILLTKDQLKELDNVSFSKVDVKCRKKHNAKDPSMFVLYLKQGYFYSAVDEFEEEHRSRRKEMNSVEDPEEEAPFN